MTWSTESRDIPPLFDGATVFVVGGGPSLRGFDWSRLAGRSVIAINQAAEVLPQAALLLFSDVGWLERNRALVEGFAGHVVTTSMVAKALLPSRLHLIGLSVAPGALPARSSGPIAVALAIAMGAVRVVLLGFDLRFVDGRSHWHDAHRAEHDQVYARMLEEWRGWGDAARVEGVEVLNATPGSALEEFPMIDLAEVLA